jgi:putative SOS response-associated peptidase YedK
MPVILPSADYALWLDRDVPGEGVQDLLRPYAKMTLSLTG